MITFLVSLLILILGYVWYSRIIERIFGISKHTQTPAYTKTDGVDYVPMHWSKTLLIQFLNIAGLGPIFGAIAGAMWGPVVFIWIVLGCVFAGAVHDYLSGLISLKQQGASIPEIIGMYLGNPVKQGMRVFTVFLMIVVGAVFIVGPAKILFGIAGGAISMNVWIAIIFVYYILAAVLPIQAIIGKLYPIFGIVLICMAFAILFGLWYYGYSIPELQWHNFRNMHNNPEQFLIFPMLFVTVACGAISGFHATQSPLMARCITNETEGRRVFYGAMIIEGIVAVIWAAIGMSFFGGVSQLQAVMNEHGGNAAWVVDTMSKTMLGKFGAIMVLLGVVFAPITSGDTAFRSARLIISDIFSIPQKMKYRILVSIPIFSAGFVLSQIDFSIIWRYMAWANQTLAAVVLWAITSYLYTHSKNYWITFIPALFMTTVSCVYIFVAPEGFYIPMNIGIIAGLSVTAIVLFLFIRYILKKSRNNSHVFHTE
ncbi:MAG TPA: carbon starvation CstA family protein [Bacteroidales bacterium]|nr:carbon starvation CstA family protein [Bacteroidales bacterium]